MTLKLCHDYLALLSSSSFGPSDSSLFSIDFCFLSLWFYFQVVLLCFLPSVSPLLFQFPIFCSLMLTAVSALFLILSLFTSFSASLFCGSLIPPRIQHHSPTSSVLILIPVLVWLEPALTRLLQRERNNYRSEAEACWKLCIHNLYSQIHWILFIFYLIMHQIHGNFWSYSYIWEFSCLPIRQTAVSYFWRRLIQM